jgi:CRISPR/Cas system-associated endonuclease Cas1
MIKKESKMRMKTVKMILCPKKSLLITKVLQSKKIHKMSRNAKKYQSKKRNLAKHPIKNPQYFKLSSQKPNQRCGYILYFKP